MHWHFYFCLSVSVAKCSSNVNLIVIWKLEPVLILQFGVEQTKAAEYIQKLVWSSARRWMWRPSIFGLLCNSGMIGWPLVLCKFVFIYIIMSKISVVLAPQLLFHSFWFLLFVLSNDLAQLSELISVWLQGRNPLFIWGEQDCGYRDTESPQGSRLGTKPSLEITADWIWRGFFLLSGCSWRAEHCKRFGHQHLWAVGIDLNNICHQLTIFFFVSGTALNLWSSKTLSSWKKLYLHSH